MQYRVETQASDLQHKVQGKLYRSYVPLLPIIVFCEKSTLGHAQSETIAAEWIFRSEEEMPPRITLAFFAARARCWIMFNFETTRTPRSWYLSSHLQSASWFDIGRFWSLTLLFYCCCFFRWYFVYCCVLIFQTSLNLAFHLHNKHG